MSMAGAIAAASFAERLSATPATSFSANSMSLTRAAFNESRAAATPFASTLTVSSSCGSVVSSSIEAIAVRNWNSDASSITRSFTAPG